MYHAAMSRRPTMVLIDSGTLPNGGRERQQLSDEVASYVRELIISGAVRSGEYLRMEKIASAVGVSNTPVREGLLSLRSEGFVQLVPRRGFVVAPFTQQDVRDLFWAEAHFAGELTARAAANMTTAQLERLAEVHELHHRAVADGDTEAIAVLGRSFHREINKAADSPRLALLLNSVVRHIPNRVLATIEGQVAAASREHGLVLAALREGDGAQARAVMQRHVLEGADHLVAALEERGVWSPEVPTPS
jgi:DNA-binding GntR family transcriptional regulator